MFKVNEISKLLSVDRSFLHYYDEIGIIVPEKNDKRYRSYNENDLIALASSKYYRAMNMPLKTLSEIILTSDLNTKLDIMQKQKQQLLKQAELYQDLSVISQAAIDIYQQAYQDEILMNQTLAAFEYIPIVHHGNYDKQLVESPQMKELLDFFPFVSYAYYFPEGALTCPEQFDYTLGLAVIPHYREKYEHSLPDNAIFSPDRDAIIFSITKDMENSTLTYEEFEQARVFAHSHQLTLTGEAIAYCVFSNYEHDHSHIKLVVYLITK